MKYFKKFYKALPIIIFSVLLSSTLLTSCTDDDNIDIEDEVTVALTQEETDMLIKMREEEKLARDVYDYLYEKQPTLTIFGYISNSEQWHMNEVLDLLNKYGIADPASPNPGEFTDPALQDLYNQLITAGEVSEADALKVGMTVEDLDIFDLEECMLQTTNEDILTVFSFLNCGSRNHMRGFYDQLILLNETYTPQFITQTEFDEIINSSYEQCNL